MAILPDFGAASFEAGAPIDNPYFPLERGSIRTYAGSTTDPETGETETETNDLFSTFESAKVYGVDTTVIRDVVYKDGRLAEDTIDWYAQDTQGNLWYFGEIVINYEYDDARKFIGTNNDGQWKSGVDGARPGWAMPAEPGFGPAYYLEYALGLAEDESLAVGLNETLSTGLGEFGNVLKVVDSSVLHPDGFEFKYYAPGVGEIREQALKRDGSTESVTDLQGIRQVGKDDDAGEDDNGEDDNGEDDNDDDDNDGDDPDVSLGALAEGQRQAAADTADGPELADVQGNAGPFYVTYLGGTAALSNALGAYSLNPGTGGIGQGKIVFAGTEVVAPGDSFAVDVGRGNGLGLFAIAGADELGLDLSAFEDGGLQFRNILTGRPASIEDGLAPLVTDARGNPLPIQALHALGNDDGANLLNPAAGVHALALAPNAPEADGGEDLELLLLGFEDSRVTSPDHDGDYNDLVVAVSRAPLSTDVLDGLLAQLGDPAEADDALIG